MNPPDNAAELITKLRAELHFAKTCASGPEVSHDDLEAIRCSMAHAQDLIAEWEVSLLPACEDEPVYLVEVYGEAGAVELAVDFGSPMPGKVERRGGISI